METNKQPQVTNLQQELVKWDLKEAACIQRYGRGIFNDREFMKAKKEVLEDIFNRYKAGKLSFDDRIELALLKGKVTQMNRQVHPANVQRMGIFLLKMLSRPLVHALKLAGNILSTFLAGKPIFSHQSRKTARRSNTNPSRTISRNQPGRDSHTLTSRSKEPKAILKRMPGERVLTSTPKNGMQVKH